MCFDDAQKALWHIRSQTFWLRFFGKTQPKTSIHQQILINRIFSDFSKQHAT
jgi:hypothetical protein